MPKPEAFFLTAEDVATLKFVISEWRGRLRNARHRRGTENSFDQDFPSPDVYIAKPQSGGGIPALTPGAGTGTDAGDMPGSALCDIYQLTETGLVFTGWAELVYNLSDSAISQRWITIKRDKFGSWLAEVSSAGSSLRLGRITGVGDSDVGTGTDTSGLSMYRVSLYDPSTLTVPTVEIAEAFSEELCCDIINASGNYAGCEGENPGTGEVCVSALLAPTLSAALYDPEQTVVALDISGRQLPLNTDVIIAPIGGVEFIIKAGLDYEKVCVLSNIECTADNQLVRTIRPFYAPAWAVCPEQTEFVSDIGSGTGTGP